MAMHLGASDPLQIGLMLIPVVIIGVIRQTHTHNSFLLSTALLSPRRHDEHIAHLESHASSLDDVVSKDQTGWLVWHADTRSWVKRPQVAFSLTSQVLGHFHSIN
eukprot:SAG31_NODE_123_length_23712_cov_41.426291_23_plen_105_part_00